MQAVAAKGGLGPSSQVRVPGRRGSIGLVADQIAIEMADQLDAVVIGVDPAEDLRLLAAACRAFARRNPTSYRPPPTHAQAGSRRRCAAARERPYAVWLGAWRGRRVQLLAARMFVAWANGFVTMELAGAFQLGRDVDEAWDFVLDCGPELGRPHTVERSDPTHEGPSSSSAPAASRAGPVPPPPGRRASPDARS